MLIQVHSMCVDIGSLPSGTLLSQSMRTNVGASLSNVGVTLSNVAAIVSSVGATLSNVAAILSNVMLVPH